MMKDAMHETIYTAQQLSLFERRPRDALARRAVNLGHLLGRPDRLERVRVVRQRLDRLSVLVVRKRQPAVRAKANLRLVDVDEDARVPERAAAAVARYDALGRPGDGLLVDELNGGEGPWLC